MNSPDPAALVAPVVGNSRLIAVVTLEDWRDSAPLARALAQGGVRTVEVTLRTPAGLDAVRAAAAEAPDALVGAGTVLNPRDLEAARDAGAGFVVSPGATADMFAAAADMGLPYLAGVATSSEVMTGLAHGYSTFKFFPAVPAGGVAYLKGLQGPFASVRFCPTGGVTLENAPQFMALPNVACVGGSWVAPEALIRAQDWPAITALARAATAAVAPAGADC